MEKLKFKILFPERHFDQLENYADLCIDSNVELYIPGKKSGVFNSHSMSCVIERYWGKTNLVFVENDRECLLNRIKFNFYERLSNPYLLTLIKR